MIAARIILAACEARVLTAADELAAVELEAIALADRRDSAIARLEWAEAMAFEAARAIAEGSRCDELAEMERAELCPF